MKTGEVLCSFGKASILPDIIESALRSGEFSLLIKGDAGTGKTTLAFEIVNILMQKNDVYYITSRVSPKALQNHFKWIPSEKMKKIIIDARTTRVSGLIKGFEKIASTDFTNLMKFIYDKLKKTTSERRPVTIILDSIDALKNSLGFAWDDYKVEQTFIDLVEREGGNIIFIVERFDRIKFDFLVDGVINLEKKYKDGRIIRYMTIQKLRGYEIRYPSRLFTLRNGRFMSFKPYGVRNPELCFHTPVNTKDRPQDALYTNFPEFDDILCGFKRGSFNVIEVSEDLGDTVRCFFWGLLENALNSDYFLYFLLPSGMGPKATFEVLKKLAKDPSKTSDKIVIFSPAFDEMNTEPEDDVIVKVSATDLNETFERTEKIILSRKEKSGMQKTFGLVGTDILEQVYGFEVLKNILPRWITNIKRLGRLMFAIVRSNQQIRDSIMSPASTYLKMEKHFGIPTVYGVSPYTPYFVIAALETDKKRKRIVVDVVPIE